MQKKLLKHTSTRRTSKNTRKIIFKLMMVSRYSRDPSPVLNMAAQNHSWPKDTWIIIWTPMSLSNNSGAPTKDATTLTAGFSDSKSIWRPTLEKKNSSAPIKSAREPSMRKEIWRPIWGCTRARNPTIATSSGAKSHFPLRAISTIISKNTRRVRLSAVEVKEMRTATIH